MVTKILIANRSENACCVIATARKLDIKTVAAYSDADKPQGRWCWPQKWPSTRFALPTPVWPVRVALLMTSYCLTRRGC